MMSEFQENNYISRSVVIEQAEQISEKILNTTVYHKYLDSKAKVKENPELWARVMEYRKRNFFLQNCDDDVKQGNIDNMQNEFHDILSNKLVKDYLRRELVLCRFIQKISAKIAEKIEMETDFL